MASIGNRRLVFQHTRASTTRRFIREHPDTFRRYVKSHVEAVHTMWTDKEATVRALGKYMGSGIDREILEKSRENVLTETFLPKKQYPSLEGLKTVLEDLAHRDPPAKSAKPDQSV